MPKIINSDNTDFLSTSFVDEDNNDDVELIEDITMEEYTRYFNHELNLMYPLPIYSEFERTRIELDVDFLINKNYHLMTPSTIKNYLKINEANVLKAINHSIFNSLFDFFKDKIYANHTTSLRTHINMYVNSLLDNKQKIKMYYDIYYSPIVIKSAKLFIYKLLLDSSSRKKYVFKDTKFRL